MRPKRLFCPTNEQSKLLSRLNDCKQNKYSLNVFSNFRKNTCTMHRTALNTWRKGSGKKSSPEESGKDHKTINTQLARHSAGGQAAHSTSGWYSLCRQRIGYFTSTAQLSKPQSLPPTHVEPQGLSWVLANFLRLLCPLLDFSDLQEKTRQRWGPGCANTISPKDGDIAP